MIGAGCVETIAKMAFDRAFLGTTGISALHGFSNSNMYEVEIKRHVVARAGRISWRCRAVIGAGTAYGRAQVIASDE